MNQFHSRRTFCKALGISWVASAPLLAQNAEHRPQLAPTASAGDLPPPENKAAQGEVPIRRPQAR